ncbi:MAG: hypothetical protein HYY65_02755 [Candidatus Tectomicrobia bacterium]|uniref:Uncharacterized protein n=1 Tax=Tectimicrobiota bacterium TaxID=2528274 RepID=A0A932GMX2_UNCTE|nr:hypothetical protein [Candidatus Tectomicrobia bacterium]
MCEQPSTNSWNYEDLLQESRPKIRDISDLLPYAEYLAAQPERRTTHIGFNGYGSTKAGDRVLIAVDSEYDDRVVAAVAAALRARGAKVDVLRIDKGPVREFDELDEIRVIIRRGPWQDNPRRWEGIPWVEELAHANKYDLLIHGKGGPIPKTDYRYEAIPWLGAEQFACPATIYPRDVHLLINQKTWDMLWRRGKGGRVRIMDPEGTDLTYTLHEGYYDGRYGFNENPVCGHLFGHPPTPMIDPEDAAGIIKGTTNHFSRPFSPITVQMEAGQVTRVEGGGAYGAAWKDLLEETRKIKYPCFPRSGLFWLWEVAIGTNPKVRRPRNIHLHSSGGHEWERRRSGIIHLGLGTLWRGPEEYWAAENKLPYGHLHVHLMFPTLEVTTKEGGTLVVINRGRLTAMDDPEVRNLAAKYGDPDRLLSEDWIPDIPGISTEGEYESYARDPAGWQYRGIRGQ